MGESSTHVTLVLLFLVGDLCFIEAADFNWEPARPGRVQRGNWGFLLGLVLRMTDERETNLAGEKEENRGRGKDNGLGRNYSRGSAAIQQPPKIKTVPSFSFQGAQKRRCLLLHFCFSQVARRLHAILLFWGKIRLKLAGYGSRKLRLLILPFDEMT